MFLLQFPITRAVFKSRLRIGEVSDTRLNLVTKLIQGIQSVKTHAWEHPIINSTLKHRRLECRSFLALFFWRGLSEGITQSSSALLGLAVVLVPLAQGKPLVASVVFTALSLTDSISYNSVRKFNYALSAAADYCSVITRLQEVLLLDEKKSFPPSLELEPP